MGVEHIRDLLIEARRARARLHSDSTQPDQPSREKFLELFDRLVAACEQLMQEHDQLGGRLRRTSIFTRPLTDFLSDEDSLEAEENAPEPESPPSNPSPSSAGGDNPH
jgi:hypothetical protein